MVNVNRTRSQSAVSMLKSADRRRKPDRSGRCTLGGLLGLSRKRSPVLSHRAFAIRPVSDLFWTVNRRLRLPVGSLEYSEDFYRPRIGDSAATAVPAYRKGDSFRYARRRESCVHRLQQPLDTLPGEML